MTRVPLPDSFLRLPITHRALHDRAAGRIENSPSAIRAAVEAGYGIEIDLQLASDGVPMVFHDETLDRLTGETGPVNTRSAAELGRIRLTGSTDSIPTLADVVRHIEHCGAQGSPLPLAVYRWLEEGLKAYCQQDTWAMVLLARQFSGQGSN